MDNLYEYIEKLTKDKGYRNITEFCRVAEIPRATMSELKSGRTKRLSAETLAKIAACLNVSVDFLLGNDEDSRALEKAKSELTAFISCNPSTGSGERLNVLFNASGYDHVIVCFNLGIEQYYLDNWMDNNDLPPKPIVDKILGVFRLKPEDLLPSNELTDYNRESQEWEANEKAPAESGKRPVGNDILDEIDVAFYGDYKELSEDDKETLRAMARVMKERQARKNQEK